MFKDELVQDIKALGGFPIYCIVTLVALLLGEKELFEALAIGLVLAFGVTLLIRTFYFTPRPIKQKFANFSQKIDASSFPSLHAMRASVLATILSNYVTSEVLIAIFFILPLLVAWARVRSKRHFVKDVIAGLVFGFLIGTFSVVIANRFL